MKSKKNISDYIILLGNRNDVDRIYQAMDVFVLPSQYEGLPVVGVEAQASGLPCILSDRMTSETKMSKNVCFLSIDKGVRIWTDEILKHKNNKRKETIDVIRENGFDISQQGNRLVDYYLELICENNG